MWRSCNGILTCAGVVQNMYMGRSCTKHRYVAKLHRNANMSGAQKMDMCRSCTKIWIAGVAHDNIVTRSGNAGAAHLVCIVSWSCTHLLNVCRGGTRSLQCVPEMHTQIWFIAQVACTLQCVLELHINSYFVICAGAAETHTHLLQTKKCQSGNHALQFMLEPHKFCNACWDRWGVLLA